MKCPSCGKSLWFVRTFCPFCKIPIAAPPRPKSVTVISWMSLLGGGMFLFLFLSPSVQHSLAQLKSQHLLSYVRVMAGPVLIIICGTFMLRGANWARWLLVLWFGCNTIESVVRAPWRLPALGSLVGLLAACLFGTVVYFLFRPAATAFFRGRAAEAPKRPPAEEAPSQPP